MFFDEVGQIDKWQRDNVSVATVQLSPLSGFGASKPDVVPIRAGYRVWSIDTKTPASQQQIANTFTDLKPIRRSGLLPARTGRQSCHVVYQSSGDPGPPPH